MKVFTLYTPKTAQLLRLWDLSWSRRGWQTRFITPRDVRKHGSLKAALPKNAIFVQPSQINFGLPPTRKKFRVSKFQARGWESAAVVQFNREFEVLNCGRHF